MQTSRKNLLRTQSLGPMANFMPEPELVWAAVVDYFRKRAKPKKVNDDGSAEEEVEFIDRDSGRVVGKKTTKYDPAGVVTEISEVWFDAIGFPASRSKETYEKGKLVKRTSWKETNRIIREGWIEEYEDRVLKKRSHQINDEEWSRTLLEEEFFEGGLLKKKIIIDDVKKTQDTYEYEYDASNRAKKITRKDKSGKLISVTETDYHDDGSYRVNITDYKEDPPLTRTYDYNQDGSLKSK